MIFRDVAIKMGTSQGYRWQLHALGLVRKDHVQDKGGQEQQGSARKLIQFTFRCIQCRYLIIFGGGISKKITQQLL